jgi:uncharacterized membrane protein YeaQ/YmgE (transglycosylase-associated protein family)
MASNLVVFVLIGLFVGAAARLFYPGRQPLRILGTLILGVAGALAGGLASWAMWPAVDGDIHYGALLTSAVGAVLVLVLWAAVAYGRSLGGRT